MKVQVSLPNAQQKSGKQVPNTANTTVTKRPSAAKLGVASPRRGVTSTNLGGQSTGMSSKSINQSLNHSMHSQKNGDNSNFNSATSHNTSSTKNQHSNAAITDKEISILRQEVEYLKLKLKDAELREVTQKEMYEVMIKSIQVEKKEEISENYKSFGDTELRLSELIDTPKQTSVQEEDLKLKIKSLNMQLREALQKLQNSETTLKLMQKDYDFMNKDSQTTINHLRLDNQRLREQLQNEKDRSVNELQLTLEEKQEREIQVVSDLQEKFDAYVKDIHHLHIREKASLEEEVQRIKSELKFLRLEHSELISNTNVDQQITSLHDEYMSEIQSLNQQLSMKSQETYLFLEAMEKEKQSLMQKIMELQETVDKLKNSKEKLKTESAKKSQEMKDKLERAFQQLTANDEAANELQNLRAQIKEMQDKISASQRNSLIGNRQASQSCYNNQDLQASNIDIKRVEIIAQTLQNQITSLRDDNQKLRKDLKKSLNSARSASPVPFRKVNHNEETKDYYNIQSTQRKRSNKGKGMFVSPKAVSRKQQQIQEQSQQYLKIEDQGSNNAKKSRGFLDSQRIQKNLHINDPQNLLNQEDQTNSQQNSPSNMKMLQSQQKQGGITARIYQQAYNNNQAEKRNGLYMNKGGVSSNDLSGLTLNTTNITTDFNGGFGNSRMYGNQTARQISKKNMSQSLSSNHLVSSPNNNSQIMQRLQSNIQSIKCASCKQELPFEEFMTHTQMCMLQDNYMIDQQQKFNSNENLANISPIKTRNKLQRLNSASSTEQKRQQQQSLVFERVRQPREYDSYLDLNEDCSTEAGGFKSQYGMQQIGQTNVQYAQRPSFLSSVDYNSFMDKGVNFMNNPNNNNQINQNFSPETIDRANGQQNKGFTQNQIRKLEERAKFFEVMYRQAQENIAKLNDDLKKQDSETERLIMDLKQTKIHIALLEETSAQREFMMKNEIDSLRHNQMVASQSQPEIKIHVNTTNYSCFNVGGSSVNNTHEIKIEPMNLLHKATQDQKVSYPPMRTPQTMKRKAQDLPKEQVYQETAPSTNHINRKQNIDSDDLKCPPKRLRSAEKEQTISTNQSFHQQSSLFHGYSQSFHNEAQSNISQDVQPESGKISLENHLKTKQQPYISKPQKGLGSPKVLTTRCSPKSIPVQK
eukprot:403334105